MQDTTTTANEVETVHVPGAGYYTSRVSIADELRAMTVKELCDEMRRIEYVTLLMPADQKPYSRMNKAELVARLGEYRTDQAASDERWEAANEEAPAVEREIVQTSNTITFTLTVEVDRNAWDRDYGTGTGVADVRADVLQYVRYQIQGSAAGESGAIVSVRERRNAR